MAGSTPTGCVISVLCVLLMSLLAPAFAQGIVAAHDRHDTHTLATASDDDDHARHHGHDLGEHDNLAHVLDHLSAKLTDLPSVIVPGIAPLVRPEPAASIRHTAPPALYRPPRPSTLA